MSSLLYRTGRFSARRPLLVITLWMAASVAVVMASSQFGRQLEDSFAVPGLDSQRAVDLLSEAHSERAGLTARVVVTPLDDGVSLVDSGAERAGLVELRDQLAALPSVLDATDPFAGGALSADGRIALIHLQYPVVEELSRDDLDELKDALAGIDADAGLRVEAGGDLFFAFEEPETQLGELIGIAAAVVILLVAFGSLIAMGLPIGMALLGLAIGASSLTLVNHLVDIPSWAPQIASMVGLGVGIDYALFLVTRHREFLGGGLDVAEAAGRAVATAGQAVLFAGGTVVISILGLTAAGVPFVTGAGVATSVVVAIMVAGSVTALPAFLGLAGPWINRLGIHRRGAAAPLAHDDLDRSRWGRWGRHVAAHPWAYTIGVTTLLLALTAPVLALELGFPDDGTLAESRTERQAYDLVAEGFGPGLNGPLLVAVDLAGNREVVDALAGAILADPGVAAVSPPEIDLDAGVATIVAFPTTAPQDAATLDTVERLRSEVFPTALAGSGASAHVGGSTANFGDIAGKVGARMPWFIVTVIVMSFLLLTVVFRSILVPLKAAVLNLLSIGAAYGVLVMVFQWGWGKDLIGLESTVPIVSFIPMFMFAILFGLSMDYEVFLLSRVREAYLDTGDNGRSVIHGLAGTARVITSAALIMISVFGGFVLGSDPTTKMFGLGLATAILVDATIVRVVLVPATMTLMGAANWWLPSWLDRRLPVLDIDGGDRNRDGDGDGGDRDRDGAGRELVPAVGGAGV